MMPTKVAGLAQAHVVTNIYTLDELVTALLPLSITLQAAEAAEILIRLCARSWRRLADSRLEDLPYPSQALADRLAARLRSLGQLFDRINLSVSREALNVSFGISLITFGYLSSAYNWTYALMQLPAEFCWTASACAASGASALFYGA